MRHEAVEFEPKPTAFVHGGFSIANIETPVATRPGADVDLQKKHFPRLDHCYADKPAAIRQRSLPAALNKVLECRARSSRPLRNILTVSIPDASRLA